MGVLDMGGSDQDVDPGQSSVPHECYTPGGARRDSFTGIDHPASGDVLLRGNRGDQYYLVPAGRRWTDAHRPDLVPRPRGARRPRDA
jgi:hypothetical protein